MAVNVATLKATFTLDNNPLKKGMAESENVIRKGAKSMEDRLKSAGASMSLAITTPLAAMAGVSINAFANFESTLNLLKETAGATTAELKQFSDLAKELGSDVKLPGTSAQDAAAAMLELNKAGLTVTETMAAARPTLELAAAGALDNARAAEIAAAAMNTFGQSASALPRINDLLANAASSSSAEIADLAESVNYGGAQARAAGFDFEQFATTLSILAQRGLKGSAAGTTLTSALVKLANPTKEATGLLNKMGLGQGKLFNSMKDTSKAAELLKKAFQGLSKEEKVRNANILVGEQGARLLLTLMDTSAEKIRATEEAMKKQGSAAAMAAARNAGLKGAIDNLKSSIETASVSIGEVLAPHIEKIAKFVADAVSKFDKWSPAAKNVAVAIAAVVAAAGPLLLVLGNLITAAKSVAGAFIFAKTATGALGVALRALLGPVGLVITAAGLLFVAWQNNWGSIRDITTSAIDFITTAVSEFAAGLGQTFGGLEMVMAGKWAMGWEEIKAGAARAWNSIGKGATVAGENDARRTQDRIDREKRANAEIVNSRKQMQSALDPMIDEPTTQSYGTGGDAKKTPKQEQYESFKEAQKRLLREVAAAEKGEATEVQALAGQYHLLDMALIKNLAGWQAHLVRINEARKATEDFEKALEQAQAEFRQAHGEEQAVERYQLMQRFTKAQTDELLKLKKETADYNKEAEKQKDIWESLYQVNTEGAIELLRQGAREIITATRNDAGEVKKQIKQVYSEEDAARAIAAWDTLRMRYEDLTDAQKMYINLNIKQKQSIEDLVNTNEQNEKYLERQKQQQLELAGMFDSYFSQVFDGLWNNGFKGFFDNVIGGFENMLQQMAAEWAKAQLVKAVMGFLDPNQTYAPEGGYGQMSAGANGFFDALTGLFGGGRADGGYMAPGQSYLVGEHGPEFVQGNGGTVIPNAGTNVNVTINLPGVTDVQSFRKSKHQVGIELAQTIKDTVERR